jgi:hypothetical protein
VRLTKEQRLEESEFIKLFNSLLSAVKILFRYSKEDVNDELFESEKVYDQLLNILVNYYIEGRDILDQLTVKILKKSNGTDVEIKNTNEIFDMLIYITGLLKNSSLNKKNQELLHSKNTMKILSSL